VNTLLSLRKQLEAAELEYKTADSSLDSSPLQIIVAKEHLKQCRFNYSQECMKAINELLDNDEFMYIANTFLNLEEVV
jgi:hypothetical protein